MLHISNITRIAGCSLLSHLVSMKFLAHADLLLYATDAVPDDAASLCASPMFTDFLERRRI